MVIVMLTFFLKNYFFSCCVASVQMVVFYAKYLFPRCSRTLFRL